MNVIRPAGLDTGDTQYVPDRRNEKRKVCRVSATVHVAQLGVLPAKIIDLSTKGIALLLPVALPRGTVGEVSFRLYVNEALHQVTAGVEVSNRVFLSADVRVGCSFVALGAAARRVLSDFAR